MLNFTLQLEITNCPPICELGQSHWFTAKLPPGSPSVPILENYTQGGKLIEPAPSSSDQGTWGGLAGKSKAQSMQQFGHSGYRLHLQPPEL